MELTIKHMEPTIASGMPPDVGPPGGIKVMVPLSGTPAGPGDTITAHPIVTGGPGMFFLLSCRKIRHPSYFHTGAFYRG